MTYYNKQMEIWDLILMGLSADNWVRIGCALGGVIVNIALFVILHKVFSRAKGSLISIHDPFVTSDSVIPSYEDSESDVIVMVKYLISNDGDRAGYSVFKSYIQDPKFPKERYYGEFEGKIQRIHLNAGDLPPHRCMRYVLPSKFRFDKNLHIVYEGTFYNNIKRKKIDFDDTPFNIPIDIIEEEKEKADFSM